MMQCFSHITCIILRKCKCCHQDSRIVLHSENTPLGTTYSISRILYQIWQLNRGMLPLWNDLYTHQRHIWSLHEYKPKVLFAHLARGKEASTNRFSNHKTTFANYQLLQWNTGLDYVGPQPQQRHFLSFLPSIFRVSLLISAIDHKSRNDTLLTRNCFRCYKQLPFLAIAFGKVDELSIFETL